MSFTEVTDPAEKAPAVDFMGLLGRCLGNFKMVERVLTAFRDTGAADLQQLLDAVAAADFESAAEISHRFKGASSNVSATALNGLLKEAELLARQHNAAELNDILERLKTEWADFERYALVFVPTTTTRSRIPSGLKQPSLEISHASAGCGR